MEAPGRPLNERSKTLRPSKRTWATISLERMYMSLCSKGVIERGSFKLVMLRFRPDKARHYAYSLRCLLNNRTSKDMHLIGDGFTSC